MCVYERECVWRDVIDVASMHVHCVSRELLCVRCFHCSYVKFTSEAQNENTGSFHNSSIQWHNGTISAVSAEVSTI